MPIRKKIKISSAKRGHHEKHKKNFAKTKKQLNKEKQLKDNIFTGKQKILKSKISKLQKPERREERRKARHEHEPVDEADIDGRMDMLESEDDDAQFDDSVFNNDNNYDSDVEAHEMEYHKITQNDAAKYENTKELLPIKTKGGILPRSAPADKPKTQKPPVEEDEEMEDSDIELETKKEQVKEVISTAELLAQREEEIERQKFFIGVTCASILEKPEEKIKSLNNMIDLITERTKEGVINFLSVRKLAMISVVEVFKDIIPEYRVGIVDTEGQKLKKATLGRVNFENELLVYYKKYLTALEGIVLVLQRKRYDKRVITIDQMQLAEIATQCMCSILMDHPYFNYGMNVGQLLVALLNNSQQNIRSIVHSCFVNVFKTDNRFDLSKHIVRHINHLVKKKEHNVFPEMLSCLKYLQIKNVNLNAEKEKELKQKKLEAHKSRVINMSKKERKRKKKLAELEKELFETKAEENKNVKEKKLTEITKLVFTIYFRILKTAPNSKLLSVTLEGLSKFAHTINIEFFEDLIEVLNHLLVNGDLGYREQLHCILTVFTILSGQGEVLTIDPSRFYTHLYKNLLLVNAGKNHDDLESLLVTLDSVLIRRRKNITYHRHLAFIKRLMTMSLQLLHNSSLGCLALVKNAIQLNSSLDILIDSENNVGSGKYDPMIEEPEFSNANCTNVYEVTRLYHHYHPYVRKFAINIANGVPATGNGMLAAELKKLTPIELYTNFDSTKMAFNPSIPAGPKTVAVKTKIRPHIFTEQSFEDKCNEYLRKDINNQNGFDFYGDLIN